jgi:general secretion pathway protein C
MNLATSLQGLPDLAAHPRVQRVMPHLPRIASGILTLVVAWQLAKLTWLLFPGPAADPNIAMGEPARVQATNRVNVQKIADAHLFGLATASNDLTDAANAPQTQMPLVLAGVMANSEPTAGFAFIGESAAMAKFRRVGESLPGGVKLHSVYIDRVMLDRGGRLESLLLPRYKGSTALPAPVAASPAQPTRFAENLRRIAETNPAAFSEIVRPQPVFAGGTQRGYRVYPGRNRQQFAKLGLQPGDLVTAVNGTPLSDQANSMQIFNTISTTDRVTLTVERNGQTQQLNINTAQIELPDVSTPTTGMPPQEGQPNGPDAALGPGGARAPAAIQ